MELSKMFGVERGEKFRVDGYCGEFMVKSQGNFERLYRVLAEGDFDKERNVNVLSDIINGAPDNIIHLPPPLTDEQRVVLMSLFTIGARYMGMSREGWKRCFVNKPQKEFSGWTCGDTQALTIANGMANCLDSLVSWPDPEPFDIGKALGVGE